MLAPGVSEDPESPFYLNQMDLWAKGQLRAAPLSRDRIEKLAVATSVIEIRPFSGEDLLAERTVAAEPEGAQFYPAIPAEDAGERILSRVSP